MAIRNFAKYLAVAVLTAACQVQEPISDSQAPAKTEPVASDVVPGIVSVQFDEYLASAIEEALAAGESVPTKAPGMGNLIEELGIESLERVFPDAGEFEPRSRKMGMHRFYKVKFSSNIPATKASASFESTPGVITAHPVRRIVKRAYESPNDPYFSRQWHYYNSSKAGVDINVRDVWKNYTTGNENVVVCVVDEAVDATHPDLKDNLWTDASGHTGYNFARKSWDLTIRPPQSYWDEGDTGHGTHVAGTIAAVSNNGVGVAGIAGGDYAAGENGVRLMSCAIFSGTSYADDTQCANAVKWGADHGAVISQNSWGPSADLNLDGNISSSELNTYRTYTIDKYHPELKVAIDYFIEYAGCDADGNQLPDSPMKGGLVFFASGNEGAEGVDWDPYAAYEPVIGVGAFNESGNRASYSTYGEWVDVAAPAGEGYSSSGSIWSTVPTKIVTSGYAGSGWAGTSMACPHASGVAALIVSYFGGQGFTAEDAKEILFGGLGNTIGGSSKPVGKKLDAMASFEYGLGHQIVPGENKAPVITLSEKEITLKAHESAVISVGASDPDGDAVDVVLEDAGSSAVSFDAATMTLRISAMKEPQGGSFTAVLKATDVPSASGAKPKSATATLSYTILPNHAPVLSSIVTDQLGSNFAAVTVNLADHFTDEDGETLRYAASVSDASVASAEISGTSAVIRPAGYGVTSVTVVATDGIGASATASFKVAFVNPGQPVMLESQNVTDALRMTIDSPETVNVSVTVYNAAGTQVLRSSATTNVFIPISMDVSSLAPGRYTAVVAYSGKSVKVKFSKY